MHKNLNILNFLNTFKYSYSMKKTGVKSKEFSCIWKTMFLYALNYTPEQEKIYRQFYRTLSLLIPCKFCRIFIKEHLNIYYPLNFKNSKCLIKSLYIWKKQVNIKISKQTGKKIYTPSFETVFKKYENLRATCDPKKGRCV